MGSLSLQGCKFLLLQQAGGVYDNHVFPKGDGQSWVNLGHSVFSILII